MVKGELPYKTYYVVNDDKTNQHGNGDIKIVTPTQAAVDQAKMSMKRKVEEEGTINTGKKRQYSQSGGRRPRGNTTNKSPTKPKGKKKSPSKRYKPYKNK